jgi:hypothetical protein
MHKQLAKKYYCRWPLKQTTRGAPGQFPSFSDTQKQKSPRAGRPAAEKILEGGTYGFLF